MKKFKKGDKVECAKHGIGEVVFVSHNKESMHPVLVVFSSIYETYTEDGREYEDEPITLTHIEEEHILECNGSAESEGFKVGDKVKDAAYGIGEVWRINNVSLYPMYVHFECGQTVQFGMNGKHIGAPIKTLQKI